MQENIIVHKIAMIIISNFKYDINIPVLNIYSNI